MLRSLVGSEMCIRDSAKAVNKERWSEARARLTRIHSLLTEDLTDQVRLLLQEGLRRVTKILSLRGELPQHRSSIRPDLHRHRLPDPDLLCKAEFALKGAQLARCLDRTQELIERAGRPAVNGAERLRALDLSMALTPGLEAGTGTVAWELENTGIPTDKIAGVPLWGPPSWQWGYQTKNRVEQRTMAVLIEAIKMPGSAAIQLNQPGPLVVEVGANEGAHGLVAARWGCRVHSFEPQPSCVRRLAFAIAMQPQNHHTAVLHHNYVSDVNFTQLVPFSPCSGTFQIGAARNISHKHGTVSYTHLTLPTKRIV
eukprot:TRINITY_DN28220_c0_g1_i7.p1 TRINITY_DN28220_c0_g1~~TRINITY_DN28220_c0_g1_i7.p1  ORF type:complete len:352 (+),score=78.08 TRINITY_DN28220_c0_g1_i7:123-1058(+)